MTTARTAGYSLLVAIPRCFVRGSVEVIGVPSEKPHQLGVIQLYIRLSHGSLFDKNASDFLDYNSYKNINKLSLNNYI